MSRNDFDLESAIGFDPDYDADELEYYAEKFNLLGSESRPRRRRKSDATPKKSHSEIISELAETAGLEVEFKTTYQPARYEAEWLMDSLRLFYSQQLITDVLAQIKGGKEASVYRCQANPTTKETFLAAKVYRPRKFRNLRNDKTYRQGRAILKPSGSEVKKNDHRVLRAVGKKTDFGVQVAHTSWLMYEYTTLERLHQAGAAVPRPVAAADNAILMSYHGDERMAAPTLNSVSLERGEAYSLYRQVLRNVELMLQQGWIHGDLSAYNILYWRGEITIIDFPQVTNSRTNPDAYEIFRRDIRRVCEYFAAQGIDCNPAAVTADLWERYAKIDPDDEAADLSAALASSESPEFPAS